MTVLNVDASRDKKSFVKDVILGVGLIDPLDCHIRMGEESGSQILVMIVLDEGIGKGACDDLVDHSLEEGNLAREERFAIHLDDLAHDRSDILDDVNLHAALGSGDGIHELSLNEWSEFIRDFKLASNKSKYCKKADCLRAGGYLAAKKVKKGRAAAKRASKQWSPDQSGASARN